MSRVIRSVAPITEAISPEVLTFCVLEGPRGKALIDESKAGVVLCVTDQLSLVGGEDAKTLIATADPRRSFMKVMGAHFSPKRDEGIHPTALVHESARLGARVYIGPYTVIGAEVRIGADTTIHAHVHVYGPATIGAGCLIHSGAVLGADGFGFWRNGDGTLEKFPHIGGIEVGDNVEIGANTAIDRGTLGMTRIRARAKIDNLVHIAHNVDVGEDSVVIANAMVAGSVRIGARSWIAPSASIRDRLTVGSDVTVGLGSVVTKSVDDGQTVFGVPARQRTEAKKP